MTLSPADYAERLAALTQKCGLDGVVCSAQEAVRFKQVFGQEDFKLVTPGIRPQGSEAGDQRRIMTPEQALAAGVDYMVISSPVTQSVDPAQTLKAINASTAECMMSDSNSRLVYSTETGRIDEPKAASTP